MCTLDQMRDGNEPDRNTLLHMADEARVFCFGWLNLFEAILMTMFATVLAAQTLEIKLADGRNGRPTVGAFSYVNIWVGRQRKKAIAIATDDKGVARLQLTRNLSEVNIPNQTGSGTIIANYPVVYYEDFFRLNAPYILCGARKGGGSPLAINNFSTKEVLDHGYVSANTCGKVTASPQPGQVVLFVRPLTFIEKLNQ